MTLFNKALWIFNANMPISYIFSFSDSINDHRNSCRDSVSSVGRVPVC